MNIYRNIMLAAVMMMTWCRCKQGDNEHNAEMIRSLSHAEEFIKEIPVGYWPLNFLRRAQKDLALDSLSNGFDSIQLRIWNGCAKGYRSGSYWFIAFILDRDGWKAELSDLFVEHSLPSGKHDSLTRRISRPNPRSGWDKFITKLFALKILSLPDFGEIQSYRDKQLDISDGCGITVEIATKKVYRVYGYNTPGVFVEHWQVKNVIEIIKLIEEEFGIKNKMSTDNKEQSVNNDSIITKKVVIQEILSKKQ